MSIDQANTLIQQGFDLSNSDVREDRLSGHAMLRRAGELGRDDAYFYLGKALEREGRYQEAETAYLEGSSRNFKASIYRLALLHGNAKVDLPDTKFYLETIEKLANDGHFPSLVRYTKERLLGSYGLWRSVSGVITLIPTIFRVLLAGFRDPDDPNFLH